jgi:hypothetical protein
MWMLRFMLLISSRRLVMAADRIAAASDGAPRPLSHHN